MFWAWRPTPWFLVARGGLSCSVRPCMKRFPFIFVNLAVLPQWPQKTRISVHFSPNRSAAGLFVHKVCDAGRMRLRHFANTTFREYSMCTALSFVAGVRVGDFSLKLRGFRAMQHLLGNREAFAGARALNLCALWWPAAHLDLHVSHAFQANCRHFPLDRHV